MDEIDLDTPRPVPPPVRLTINWRGVLFLLGLFGLAVFVARTWSADAGVVVFVVGLGLMFVAAIVSSNRAGDGAMLAGDGAAGWDGDADGGGFGDGGGGGDGGS